MGVFPYGGRREAGIEAVEFAREAERRGSGHILDHLGVLLEANGLGWDDVAEKLQSWTSMSGLHEKRSKKQVAVAFCPWQIVLKWPQCSGQHSECAMQLAAHHKSLDALAGLTVYPVASFAVAHGLDRDRVEDTIGCKISRLSDFDRAVDIKNINTLWGLLDSQWTGEDAAAIAFGKATSYRHYRGLGKGASFAPTLREALRFVCEFCSVLSVHLDFRLDESNSRAAFSTFDPSDSLSNGHSTQSAAVILFEWIRDWVRHDVRPEKVYFVHGQCGSRESYTDYFGSNVKFDHNTDRGWVEFDRAVLDLPLRSSNPAAFTVSRLLAQKHLEHRTAAWNDPILYSVKRAVADCARHGVFKVSESIRQARVPMRSAQRHAAQQGLHLIDFVQQERAEVACAHLLHDPETSLSALVDALAFSDERALRRSFQRWTGVSPAVFRQALRT